MIGEEPLPGSRDPAGTMFRDAEGFPWALLVPTDWRHPNDGHRIEIPYPSVHAVEAEPWSGIH
jgi:hypothetical protein